MREGIAMIKVDLSGAAGFFDPRGRIMRPLHGRTRALLEHSGAGAEFTGWLDLPGRIQNGELKQILTAASRIRGRAQALVVVGIGGSYLGAKGAVELLRPHPAARRPKILFARKLPVAGRADAPARGTGRSGF